MADERPTCDICGWEPDATSENPVNSVIAHISSSKGDHEGIGYQQARTFVDGDPEPVDDTPDADSDETGDIETDVAGDEQTDVDGDSDSSDGGLGLSGAPDVGDDSSDADPSDAAIDDSQDTGSDSDSSPDISSDGWGPVAAVGGLILMGVLALAGRQGDSADESDDEDELDLV